MTDELIAVVLAGGRGTRMSPATAEPKHLSLLPLAAGERPILDILLCSLEALFGDVLVAVAHLADQVERFVAVTHPSTRTVRVPLDDLPDAIDVALAHAGGVTAVVFEGDIVVPHQARAAFVEHLHRQPPTEVEPIVLLGVEKPGALGAATLDEDSGTVRAVRPTRPGEKTRLSIAAMALHSVVHGKIGELHALATCLDGTSAGSAHRVAWAALERRLTVRLLRSPNGSVNVNRQGDLRDAAALLDRRQDVWDQR